MREIKFRAWEINRKEWHYFHIPTDIGRIIEGMSYFLNYEKWCEFTGLHDRNGKEVWEGDIFSMWGFINTVIWRDGAFGYVDDTETFHPFADHQWVTKPKMKEVRVIGNKFEGYANDSQTSKTN